MARSRNSGRPLRKPSTASSSIATVPTVLAACTRSNTVGPSAARASASASVDQQRQRGGREHQRLPSQALHAPVHLAADQPSAPLARERVHQELAAVAPRS